MRLRTFVRFLFLLIVLAAGAAGWLWYRATSPYKGFAGDEVFVELPPGTSVSGIAARLADAGVVGDPIAFRVAARWSGQERRLQAGEYRFAAPATAFEIVSRLAQGDVFARSVTFPEGLTIREMAALYEKAGLGQARDFISAAGNGARAGDFDPEARTLEGFLFPDTYSLPRTAGADELIAAMLSRFGQAFTTDLREAAVAQGFSPREVVTLASIVEKETGQGDERPLVAAVYRNRLRIGMPLQCDPTVIYAKMLNGTWRGNLTRADLQMVSPYNTYRVAGLPPGPIASPGKASLEAVLRPADVPYLYFVSRNDGTHVFASTLEEHNRNVAKYQLHQPVKRRPT